MAGLISGIVALFTSYLGISGTVIGSVLSSFLYQFLSSYSAEKYEERYEEMHAGGNNSGNGKKVKKISITQSTKLGSEIVYVFPLVVIVLIELIFVFSALHYRFDMLFDMLEAAVNNNLFRLMGISLIIMGIFPLISSRYIEKINGKIVLVVGILVFLRGIVDITSITAELYSIVFSRFDLIFTLVIIVALLYVIFNVLKNSADDYRNSAGDEAYSSGDYPRASKKPRARKIDTSFHKADEYNRSRNMAKNGFNTGVSDFNNSNASNASNSSNRVDNINKPGNNHNLDYPVEEDLPIYEEEIIYVNNPDNPDRPIKKRILKRVDPNHRHEDYDETYVIDDENMF